MEIERNVMRRYVFTQKQLHKKLNMVGEIKNMGLWSGRSPNDVEGKVSTDNNCWVIETDYMELEEEDAKEVEGE